MEPSIHRLRTRFGVLLGCLLAVGLAPSCTTPDGPPPHASDKPVDSEPDSGPYVDAGPAGTVMVVSSANLLPPAWQITDAGLLAESVPDGGDASVAYLNERVELTAALTTNSNPCPVPFTTATGKTYCDGFNAVDAAGQAVVVDSFTYLGTGAPCYAQMPTNPTDSLTLPSIGGVWGDNYNSTTGVDQLVLNLATCADMPGVAQGTPYAGVNMPPMTTDIAMLLSSFSPGATVTVHGVVIAAWSSSSTGSFGFSMEDPAGGPGAGIAVVRPSNSNSTTVAPNLGDYVSVTGFIVAAGVSYEIHL